MRKLNSRAINGNEQKGGDYISSEKEKPARKRKRVPFQEREESRQNFKKQSKKNLVFPVGIKWMNHDTLVEEPETWNQPPMSEIVQLKKTAQELLEAETKRYLAVLPSREEAKDLEWARTLIRSGTTPDKMAAYTLLIQDSPLHNLIHIRNLASLVDAKSKREGTSAMDTFTELFLSDLALSFRRFRPFERQPIPSVKSLPSELQNKALMMFYFENELRNIFQKFLSGVESLLKDTVAAKRIHALKTIYTILCSCPEQEHKLLEMLVNKLGDPDRKVGSVAWHRLRTLLEKNPGMKTVIVDSLERLVFRPNVSLRAQHSGVSTMSEFVFDRSSEAGSLAARMVLIYFTLFKALIEKGEVESRIMAALLMGVHRAYPYAKEYLDSSVFADNLEILYRVIHLSNFNVATQALVLLYNVMDREDGSATERFYSVLYRKLLDPELPLASKQPAFLNILFKALTKDSIVKRIGAFLHRLLHCVTSVYPVPLSCGILMLVARLLKQYPQLLTMRLDRLTVGSEGADDDEEEHYEDVPCETDSKQHSSVRSHEDCSWIHRSNLKLKKSSSAKMDARNPLYAESGTPPWSLEYLCSHYHPTIALFAEKIVKGSEVEYPGDPLEYFTSARFLERFVFKNPKKSLLDTDNAVFAQAEDEFIKAENRFFSEYLQASQAVSKRLTGKAESVRSDEDSVDEDASSVNSEEFDQYLDDIGFPSGETADDEDSGLMDEGLDSTDEERDSDDDESGDDVSAEDDFDFAGDIHVPTESKKRKSLDDSDDEANDEDDGDLHVIEKDEINSEEVDSDVASGAVNDEFVTADQLQKILEKSSFGSHTKQDQWMAQKMKSGSRTSFSKFASKSARVKRMRK